MPGRPASLSPRSCCRPGWGAPWAQTPRAEASGQVSGGEAARAADSHQQSHRPRGLGPGPGQSSPSPRLLLAPPPPSGTASPGEGLSHGSPTPASSSLGTPSLGRLPLPWPPRPPAPSLLPAQRRHPRLNKSSFDGACGSDTVPFSHLETSIAASSFLPAAQEGASWRPAQRSPDPRQLEAGPVQASRWRGCTGPRPGAPGLPSPLPQALASVPCRSRGLGIPPLPVSGLSSASPGQVPGGFPPPPSDITKADP